MNPRFGGAFPLPLSAGSSYPELVLAIAEGERPEPRLGEFREGVVMTRFYSHLSLAVGSDGYEPFAEEVPEPIGSEEPSAELEAMQSLGRQSMLELIDKLSPEQQQVLTLKFVFNFANADVAKILDKTEGAIKSLQHRALASLQKQLSQEQ